MSVELPPTLWPFLHGLAAQRPWPPESEATADLLVAQAEREGLLALLFAEPDPPPTLRAALERWSAWPRLQARRAEILLDALRTLSRLLDGEDVLLLKGADYAHRLYPRPELRPMRDLDVLVRRERAEPVTRRLEAAGLTRVFPGGVASHLASYYERVFLFGEVALEVHLGFVQRARHRIDYDAVWRRRVPLALGPPCVWRLSDADALAQHALAMAKDEFSVPLIRYVDLWLLLRAAPGAVAEATDRAREWKSVHAFYGALRQACRLFPEFAAADPVRRALGGLLGPATRRFLDRFVLPGPAHYGRGKNMTRPVELWRKFWLMDDPARRAAFGLYHGYALVAGRLLARGGRR